MDILKMRPCLFGMGCLLLAALASAAAIDAPGTKVRVKDVCHVQGVRENVVWGYGLVIGLRGTGDKRGTQFTTQTLASMLERLNITVAPDRVQVKNVAAVMVTAKLPPFAKEGSRIDCTVSSLGDASSLEGGTLLPTELRAGDGEVYAVASGPVSIGGFNVEAGEEGDRVQKNHATVGRIPLGATVEREVPTILSGRSLMLTLDSADFTTASRLARVLDEAFGDGSATALDAATVQVAVPQDKENDIVGFISQVEHLTLEPDTVAKVVLNERTGTIVMGQNVQISPVAVSHGSLNVEIRVRLGVSQPAPFAPGGETVVVPQTRARVTEEKSDLISLPAAATMQELVDALNALGVTPRDMIAIFQAIKEAGAIQAKLEIM